MLWIYQKDKDISFNTEEKNVVNTAVIEENNDEDNNKKDEIVEIDLPEKMGNYTVIGQIVIDKIGVEKNILNKTEDASLNLSVTKFYGPKINEAGNFCITGHNYKDMLKRLNELSEGDTFYLINREQKTKVTYEIYKIYTCNPTDLDCLDQPKDGTREVTLITCNPGGLTRLICKAKEV